MRIIFQATQINNSLLLVYLKSFSLLSLNSFVVRYQQSLLVCTLTLFISRDKEVTTVAKISHLKSQ